MPRLPRPSACLYLWLALAGLIVGAFLFPAGTVSAAAAESSDRATATLNQQTFSRSDAEPPALQPAGRTAPSPRAKAALDYARLVVNQLLLPLLRLTLFIALGLLLGNLIEALHWTQALGRIARPLLRWGRFSDHSAIAFTAAFFSGVTANTMLMNAYQDQRIGRSELICANILNTLPSYFLHLPTTFFVLLPLVREAGFLYLLCTLIAAIGRALVVLAFGHWRFSAGFETTPPKPDSERRTGLIRQVRDKFKRRFRRVVAWTLPIYSLFFLAAQAGLFRWIESFLTQRLTAPFFPVEALSVIAFQVVAEFTAGAAAAGALIDAGTLSIGQTVLALLAGNIVATPVRALRHQLPYYMGIFTPRLGLLLLTVSQLARTVSLLLTAWLFYWFY